MIFSSSPLNFTNEHVLSKSSPFRVLSTSNYRLSRAGGIATVINL